MPQGPPNPVHCNITVSFADGKITYSGDSTDGNVDVPCVEGNTITFLRDSAQADWSFQSFMVGREAANGQKIDFASTWGVKLGDDRIVITDNNRNDSQEDHPYTYSINLQTANGERQLDPVIMNKWAGSP